MIHTITVPALDEATNQPAEIQIVAADMSPDQSALTLYDATTGRAVYLDASRQWRLAEDESEADEITYAYSEDTTEWFDIVNRKLNAFGLQIDKFVYGLPNLSLNGFLVSSFTLKFTQTQF